MNTPITTKSYQATRIRAEGIVDIIDGAKDRNQAIDYVTAIILHADSRKNALPAAIKDALSADDLQDKVTAVQNDIAARLSKCCFDLKTFVNTLNGKPVSMAEKTAIYSTLVKLSEAQGFKNTAMFLTDPSTIPPTVPPEPKAETTAIIIDPETKTSYPAQKLSAVETLFDVMQNSGDEFARTETAKYIVQTFGYDMALKSEPPKS